jgi:hypothetical protein
VAFTQDFFTSYRGYDDGETRIGDRNRLWYDSNTNTIRISDGETPGGIIIGGSGGGTYILPTASTTIKGGVKIDGNTITINNGVISSLAPTDISQLTDNTNVLLSLGSNQNLDGGHY